MKRLFLLVFGLYGIVVACFDGIGPFLEFSFLIAWVVDNWPIWVRAFWASIFSLLGISLPIWIADCLSGIVYGISTVAGLRSISSWGFKKFLIAAKIREELIDNSSDLPKLIKWLIGYTTACALYFPYIVILVLLVRSSPYLGASYSWVSLFAAYMPDILRSKGGFFKRLQELLVGEMPDDMEADQIIALSFLSVPFYALLLLLILLLLNEVAIQGDNIVNFINWVRCDAGIDCAK